MRQLQVESPGTPRIPREEAVSCLLHTHRLGGGHHACVRVEGQRGADHGHRLGRHDAVAQRQPQRLRTAAGACACASSSWPPTGHVISRKPHTLGAPAWLAVERQRAPPSWRRAQGPVATLAEAHHNYAAHSWKQHRRRDDSRPPRLGAPQAPGRRHRQNERRAEEGVLPRAQREDGVQERAHGPPELRAPEARKVRLPAGRPADQRAVQRGGRTLLRRHADSCCCAVCLRSSRHVRAGTAPPRFSSLPPPPWAA